MDSVYWDSLTVYRDEEVLLDRKGLQSRNVYSCQPLVVCLQLLGMK